MNYNRNPSFIYFIGCSVRKSTVESQPFPSASTVAVMCIWGYLEDLPLCTDRDSGSGLTTTNDPSNKFDEKCRLYIIARMWSRHIVPIRRFWDNPRIAIIPGRCVRSTAPEHSFFEQTRCCMASGSRRLSVLSVSGNFVIHRIDCDV